jgi:LacI family transcriptional regulator
MKTRQRKILVAIPTNGPDGRLRVAGVLKYANTRTNWDLRIVSSRTAFTDAEVRELLVGGLDGCILAAYTPAVEEILKKRIPTILALENMHEQIGERPNCLSVLMDNHEIGRLAAEHFKSLGRFASYAFIPAPPKIPWSLERKAAFFENADKRSNFFEFPESEFEMVNMTGEAGIQVRTEELVDFLKSLPRPAAVFAANDLLAVQVVKACRVAHIKVPTSLAVIGCDNDELLCQGERPALTSILPGFEKAGFAAARALDAFLHGKPLASHELRIPGAALVPRSSTTTLPPAVAVVNAAMDFIKTHALDGISTADVISHLRISRSLLDLRFRQLRNESVMDAILGIRLAAVRERIEKTDKKFLAIGAECGFRNPDYLKRLFRKRFGMSMREWRDSARK